MHCVGANFIDSTVNQSDLLDKVKDHYSVVWEVVQLAYKDGNDKDDKKGVIGAVEGLLFNNNNDSDKKSTNHEQIVFRASSFSHHLARHCQECDSESAVQKWCFKNVKVERITKKEMDI